MTSLRGSASGLSSVHRSSDVDRDSSSPSESQLIASDVMEEMASLALDQSSKPCGPCQEAATNKVFMAKWFCQDCAEYLCQGCRDDHDALDIMSGHNVFEIEINCSPCAKKNQTTTSDWYCKDCRVHLCSLCKPAHRKFKATKNHEIVSNQEMREWKGTTKSSAENSHVDKEVKQTRVTRNLGGTKQTEIHPVVKKARAANLKSAFNVKLTSDTATPYIWSSAFLPDGRLLLVDNNNKKLKMFDDKFNFTKEKKFDDCLGRIAVYDANEIALTRSTNTLTRLSVDKDIVIKKSMSVGFDCWAVDYITRDRLAVTGEDPDMLYVMTTDGHVLSRISTDRTGKQLFDAPGYVTVDRTRSRVYVSNWGSDTVCALDLAANNDVIFTYKHKDLHAPARMAVDQEGNLYICGFHSHNVHLVSPGGQYIKTLLSDKDGLNNPQTMSFTPDGDTFFIGSFITDILSVYTLQ